MSPDKFCLCENMQKSQVRAPQAFVWGGQSISQKEGWGVWETFKNEKMKNFFGTLLPSYLGVCPTIIQKIKCKWLLRLIFSSHKIVFAFSLCCITMHADIEMVRTAQRERRNNSSSVFLYWQPMSREPRERDWYQKYDCKPLRNTIAQHEKYIWAGRQGAELRLISEC